MTIEIEARLEELFDKHERQIDSEREVLRSMKAERDYFNKMNPQGALGGGGFLDKIIKGITSKGIIGGLVAGGAAGGVLALIDVIKDLTKQSKILTTIQDTVGKSLGLLVDLVLLPFLPLLIFGLLYLYTAIMWVGKIWNDWIQKQLTGGLGKAIDKVINPPAGSTALSRTIDFLSLMNELAKAWFDGMRRIILGTLIFFADLLIQIGKFLWDIGWEIGTKLADAIWKVLEPAYIQIAIWWDNTVKLVTEAWEKIANTFDEKFIAPIKSALNTLRDSFGNLIQWVIDKINTILPPGFKIGSQVEIVQSGKQGQFGSDWTGNTYHFNGLTMPELENKIIEINNRESRVHGSRLYL